MFEFTTGVAALRLDDDEAAGATSLPPLESGAEDILGDRGVVIKRRSPPANRSSPLASGKNRFVELHYDAFVGSDKFDSTKDQNYAAIVELDLPPSGASNIVRAWEAALQKVRAGEVFTLYAQARYAYGTEGDASGVVKPGSDIRYEIEVIDIRSSKKVVIVEGRTTEGDERERLDAIRIEREIASQRRADEKVLKDAENAKKAEKAAALKAKMDAKRAGAGNKGKKKKSKK